MSDIIGSLKGLTPKQIGSIPRENAQEIINYGARSNLARALVTALLVGAGARGTMGIIGNMRRNIQRRGEREDASKPTHEISVPIKTATYPDWYPAALALGVPGALAGGWMGMGSLMRRFRRLRSRQELEKAKSEFEDALSDERNLKFSTDLNSLAEAWVSGELSESTLEKASSNIMDASWKAYLAAAALMALAGGGVGWKLTGENPEAEHIKAYREAMRRRQTIRPISLIARSQAMSSAPQNEEHVTDVNKIASAKCARALLPALKKLPGTAMKLGGGALGTSWLMTNTPFGKRWMASRSRDLMGDPEFMQRQTQLMLNNPQIMRQIYEQMMPTITARMIQQRPVMGRLMAYLMGTHQMPRPDTTQYY